MLVAVGAIFRLLMVRPAPSSWPVNPPEFSDRHEASARIPIRRSAGVDIIGQHVVLAEQRRAAADALQPIDIRDRIRRKWRAVAGDRTQERGAGVDPEVLRSKTWQGSKL